MLVLFYFTTANATKSSDNHRRTHATVEHFDMLIFDHNVQMLMQ